MQPSTLQDIVKSYLYFQYNNDLDLQALVNAYNGQSQLVLDWFNNLNAPIYTNLSGTFILNGVTYNYLDYLVTAIYGYPRPPAFNDDQYKRCLTWNFYKDDGFIFCVEWLKRRVARFLYGTNGTNVQIDFTPTISVTYKDYTTVVIGIHEEGPIASVPSAFMPIAAYDRAEDTKTIIRQTIVIRTPVPSSTISKKLKTGILNGYLYLPQEFTFEVDP